MSFTLLPWGAERSTPSSRLVGLRDEANWVAVAETSEIVWDRP